MTTTLPEAPPSEEPVKADPVTELLKAAQMEIMAGWCQNSAAVDPEGQEVEPTSERAVAVCAVGALERACARDAAWKSLFGDAEERLDHVVRGLTTGGGWHDIFDYNDEEGTTKEDVIQVFERAINA
jgi:hypothetical protein